jgi:hypothetical protein
MSVSNNMDECSVFSSDSKIVAEENSKKFIISNESRVEVKKVQVDGCLILEDRKKCDWLFDIASQHCVYFVELKGKNIPKAVEQLASTIEFTRSYFVDYEKESYIVSSRVPKMTTDLAKIRKKFFMENQSILNIRNNRIEVKI